MQEELFKESCLYCTSVEVEDDTHGRAVTDLLPAPFPSNCLKVQSNQSKLLNIEHAREREL